MADAFTLDIDIDIENLKSALSESTLRKRRMDFADSVADKMEPYVPMSGGGEKKSHLRDRGNRTIDESKITYEMNYSAAVYAMDESYNYTTTGTRGHWDELFVESAANVAWLKDTAEKLLMEGLD